MAVGYHPDYNDWRRINRCYNNEKYRNMIVKQVDEKTRAKTGINELLRSAE